MSATVLMVVACERSVYLNDINQVIYGAVFFQQNVSIVTLVLLHMAMSACWNANISCMAEKKDCVQTLDNQRSSLQESQAVTQNLPAER